MGGFGSKSLVESFGHAWQGVWHSWVNERNMRVHTVCAFFALSLSWLLETSTAEFVAVALISGMVVVAELANTALEALIDLVLNDHHPLARVSKDVAAGAVLVTSFIAVFVGIAVFGPYVIDYGRTSRILAQKPLACGLVTVSSVALVLVSLLVPYDG